MAFGTAVAMMITRTDYILVASFFSGLFIFIPLVGPFLALVPPLLVALLTVPDSFFLLLILLLILQAVVMNVLAPKLLSDALGLHPLIVFAALLLGVKVAGFWGAIFAVPLAGVISTMAVHLYEIIGKRMLAASIAGQALAGIPRAAPNQEPLLPLQDSNPFK